MSDDDSHRKGRCRVAGWEGERIGHAYRKIRKRNTITGPIAHQQALRQVIDHLSQRHRYAAKEHMPRATRPAKEEQRYTNHSPPVAITKPGNPDHPLPQQP